jgi:ectoine hydroxylase-related dioxygenase (phytanoyl-CoA dioxygenase family)
MTKGSVLLYTGSVFHGGGANTTNTSRIGMNVGYSLGWLRQEKTNISPARPRSPAPSPRGCSG